MVKGNKYFLLLCGVGLLFCTPFSVKASHTKMNTSYNNRIVNINQGNHNVYGIRNINQGKNYIRKYTNRRYRRNHHLTSNVLKNVNQGKFKKHIRDINQGNNYIRKHRKHNHKHNYKHNHYLRNFNQGRPEKYFTDINQGNNYIGELVKGKSKSHRLILKRVKNINQGNPLGNVKISGKHSPKTFAVTRPNSQVANAFDISQWQGLLTQNQANQLKHEVNFMILRAQAGNYADMQIGHNISLMQNAGIPYGVYSYSYYTNPANAALEARDLVQRAPKANFYANDCEENDAGGNLDLATHVWANTVHQLTRKPVILYSNLAFMNANFSRATLNSYNGLWVADYSQEPNPSYHYDLWQNSDGTYSSALGQKVDADVFPQNINKPLSFWTRGQYHSHYQNHIQHKQSTAYQSYHITRYKRQITHLKHLVRKYRHELKIKNQNIHNVNSRDKLLQHELNNVSAQLERILHASGMHIPKSLIFYQIPFNYYRSPHVHVLHVVRRKGIELYSPKSHHRIRVAGYGAKLTHVHFKYIHFHRHWITRSIGRWHGHKVSFTSNKSCVNWLP